MNAKTIIIGADLVPNKFNEDLFEEGLSEKIVGKQLNEVLNESDARFFNLETVIYDGETPIQKCGPCLKTPTSVMPGIKALNPSIVTLANNHIMDHGIDGLASTIDQLKKHDIEYVGVGSNISEAQKPYYYKLGDMKVGIYACTEHEFSIANEEKPGVNPIDYLEISDHIKQLKDESDYVIVLYHGGSEKYRYVAPYLQKLCRKLVDCGADLVVCQHSHCVGCKESYNGGEIVYGQGNFIFHNEDEFFQTALLVKVSLWREEKNIRSAIEYIPINQTERGVELSDSNKRLEILDGFFGRSEEIKDRNNILRNYDEFSEMMMKVVYYPRALGKIGDNIIFRCINRLAHKKIGRWFFATKQKNYVLNVIECEAHRELFIYGLKK